MSAALKTKTASHNQESSPPSKRQLPAGLRAAILALGVVLAGGMGAQLTVESLYAGRVYPGVRVAGVDVGGSSLAQARSALKQRLRDYAVTLQVGDRTYRASPAQVGVDYDVSATLDDAYLRGRNHWYAPLGLLDASRQPVAFAYRVDAPRQAGFVEAVVKQTGRAPVDASVVINEGVPQVKPDTNGIGLSREEVVAAINRLASAAERQPVKLQVSSQPAEITADKVTTAIDETKILLAVPVTLTYQGRTFRPTPADMGEWIAYDKATSGKPVLVPRIREDGIKHYLQFVALAINVNPVNRKVVVENGVSREERPGKEGLQLDQDALSKLIAASVASKKAVLAEAPTRPVPFQTEYNRVVTLDYGRYVEINLSKQRMWVYQDKKVIYESPITSGATGAGYPTIQGLFSIQAKQTNRNLNGYAIGYDYNVFVKYWMPFSGNFGLHDASWRTAFGGADYYYNGSHGCVNLPSAAAAFLFGWATVGTPVWVHN